MQHRTHYQKDFPQIKISECVRFNLENPIYRVITGDCEIKGDLISSADIRRAVENLKTTLKELIPDEEIFAEIEETIDQFVEERNFNF